VQTSPGLPDPRVESVHGLLPPIVLATKADPRGGLLEAVSRQWPCLGYEKVAAIVSYEHGEVVNHKRVARIRRQRGLMASRGHGGKRRRLRPGLALRRSASRPDEV